MQQSRESSNTYCEVKDTKEGSSASLGGISIVLTFFILELGDYGHIYYVETDDGHKDYIEVKIVTTSWTR